MGCSIFRSGGVEMMTVEDFIELLQDLPDEDKKLEIFYVDFHMPDKEEICISKYNEFANDTIIIS